MNYSAMTIEELQRFGISGDEKAILELGRKVLDFDLNDFFALSIPHQMMVCDDGLRHEYNHEYNWGET